MRIAVFAAGAVGGYFGGRLAQAGEDVSFIARGEHLRAIRDRGLRVESPAGDFTIRPARATDDPASVGPVDVVLVAVKTWQLPEAVRAMKPLVGGRTMVVPMLNGVEAPELLSEAIGREHVIGGFCRIFANLAAPGLVRHRGFEPSIDIGELDGGTSDRVRRFVDVLRRARGMTASGHDAIRTGMWVKLLFVGPIGAVGAAARESIGAVASTPQTRALLEQAMREVAAVARARSVPVPEETVEGIATFVDGLPGDEVASMQRDIMAGRPSELDGQVGVVVRLGTEAGVDTPVHRFLYAVLLPGERRARGQGAGSASSPVASR